MGLDNEIEAEAFQWQWEWEWEQEQRQGQERLQQSQRPQKQPYFLPDDLPQSCCRCGFQIESQSVSQSVGYLSLE